MIQTVYGVGGYCENCNPSHPHPLHNIIEQFEVPEPAEEVARQSAIAKLQAIGLTAEEAQALLGISNG